MWKVVGHMNAGDGRRGKVPFGPHPVKVWQGPHRVKGYRRRKPVSATRACAPASVNMQAETYARWLAARDGISVPALCRVAVHMTTIESAHRTMMRNGRAVPKVESRVMAVSFAEVSEADRYGRVVDTGRVVHIELPNWSFDPRDPVEEVDTVETVAAAAADDDSWLFLPDSPWMAAFEAEVMGAA